MQGGVVVVSTPRSERGEHDFEERGASAGGGGGSGGGSGGKSGGGSGGSSWGRSGGSSVGGSGDGAWRMLKEERRASSDFTVWRAATSRWMQR
eukprot:scaffold42348_cov26-Phaeocystis_antarctica.AAC.1